MNVIWGYSFQECKDRAMRLEYTKRVIEKAEKTNGKAIGNLEVSILHFKEWKASNDLAQAVVFALPRNDAEVELFVEGLLTTAGDPT